MRKTSIAIACILVLWSSIGFTRSASVQTDKTLSAHAESLPVSKPGEAPGSRQAMTDIHDIKPLVPVPMPISWSAIGLWTALCIVAGGLLFFAWFLRRRRHGPSVETVESVLSPEQTAFQRLANLSMEPGMDGKAFYFQLSFIFRDYLHGRFGIDGVEMTTEELLPRLETVSIGKELKRDAKRFIVSCDPVKYAEAPTFQNAMAADYAFVKSFVERTTTPVQDSSESTEGSPKSFPE